MSETRRLLGFDRSGPEPKATRAGAPLRPWTVPNLLGFIRIALIPVFLWIAFNDPNGKSVTAAVLYGALAWSDYFDGLIARATGQYSRLGALLDPLSDRLLVISGVAVCWYFTLLPRWVLLVLAVREVVMLVITRVGLALGIDINVNWFGRLAVWPLFSAVFFALLGVAVLPEVLIYVGATLALLATILYCQQGGAAWLKKKAS